MKRDDPVLLTTMGFSAGRPDPLNRINDAYPDEPGPSCTCFLKMYFIFTIASLNLFGHVKLIDTIIKKLYSDVVPIFLRVEIGESQLNAIAIGHLNQVRAIQIGPII